MGREEVRLFFRTRTGMKVKDASVRRKVTGEDDTEVGTFMETCRGRKGKGKGKD